MSRYSSALVLSLAVGSLVPSQVLGELVEAEFSGEITHVSGSTSGQIEVGDTIAGSYAFNTNATDRYPDDPSMGAFSDSTAAICISASLGAGHLAWTFGPDQGGCIYQTFDDALINDGLTQDQLAIRSRGPVDVSSIDGRLPVGVELGLTDSGGLLSSDAVPTGRLSGYAFGNLTLRFDLASAELSDRVQIRFVPKDPTLLGVGSQVSRLDELKDRIDRYRLVMPSPPEYRYSLDSFSGAVSTVWADITSDLLATDHLRSQYDDFYAAAIGYRTSAQLSLIYADRHRSAGLVDAAESSLEDFQRSIKQFNLCVMGAHAAWEGNLEAANVLARGIYSGSKLSLEVAGWISQPILGPSVAHLVDGLFLATDWAVESSETSMSKANKQLLSKIIAKAIFDYGKVEGLGGRSLAEAIDSGVSTSVGQSGLYELLGELYSAPHWREAAMSIIANSTSGAIRSISEREYTRIIEAIQQPSDLPLADADQVISGRFSGRVVVTDKGSSAFSVDDHVTVEVRYDTAPDEVHQFPDYSATGYYFSGDPNRGEMVVRIGNEVWSSGSRLEIFVQNDRSDGGPDMVRFGGFHSVDASSAQRARIQFFLADNSISSLLSDERMPTSLSDLDFSGAESPDCCFWGLIESDSAPHYSTILVKIDRSTFELSIDDGR